jgi:phospholipid/cholesterol/gamma-HCH transport system substrate-binding protein
VNTETKVGTFVLACVALLGITVYFVGNEQWGHQLTPYKTYLRYAGGVGPGAEVLFGGIAVGRVTAVRAWRDDPTRIEVLLEVKEGTPFNEKSVASLGAVSLMSSPAISVTTGSNDARRLNPGEAIPSQETVSIDEMARRLAGIADSAGRLITEVQSEIGDIGGQAKKLLANLNEVSGPDNRTQIAGLLRQANNLMSQEGPKLDRITDQVLAATQDADAAIKKVGPLVDRADATVENVNSTVDQLRDPIQQDLAQLQSTMEQVKSVITSVQAMVKVNDGNVRDTLDDLRVAAENLDQLSENVKQRPWSLVRIRQPKDRKVPQAK